MSSTRAASGSDKQICSKGNANAFPLFDVVTVAARLRWVRKPECPLGGSAGSGINR